MNRTVDDFIVILEVDTGCLIRTKRHSALGEGLDTAALKEDLARGMFRGRSYTVWSPFCLFPLFAFYGVFVGVAKLRLVHEALSPLPWKHFTGERCD